MFEIALSLELQFWLFVDRFKDDFCFEKDHLPLRGRLYQLFADVWWARFIQQHHFKSMTLRQSMSIDHGDSTSRPWRSPSSKTKRDEANELSSKRIGIIQGWALI